MIGIGPSIYEERSKLSQFSKNAPLLTLPLTRIYLALPLQVGRLTTTAEKPSAED